MAKLYPIGVQNFATLREDGYIYVDKTGFIDSLRKSGKIMFRTKKFGLPYVSTVLKSVMCFVMFFFLNFESRSQTFGFTSSNFVMVKDGNAFKTGDKGMLVIQKEGSKWVAQITLGDNPGPVAHMSSLKVMNGKRGVYVKGVSDDFNFEINSSQLTITTQNYAIVFSNETLGSDYQRQFSSLMSKLGGSPSSGSNSSRSGSSSGSDKSTLLPTSGNLTPVTFASHPFGFMPRGPMSLAKACDYLRQAHWPSDPYDNSLITIISCTAFKIPFKVYGKDVTSMSMYWGEGNYTTYDLEISDLKDNWTKDASIRMAERIYDDLIANGYKTTEVKISYSGHFVEKAVTNGKVYIQISAGENSLFAKLDSFSVEMSVRYL